MESKRSYGDGCGIAHALDLVGERWALLIVRELLLGPKRFTDLRAGLPNASSNMVTQRLTELEQFGVIQRRRLAPPAASWVYELTPRGRELEPILLSLGTWGVQSPYLDGTAPISVDSLLLTLKTYFQREAAGDLDARYELRSEANRWSIQVTDGAISIANGPSLRTDAVIEAAPKTFVDLVGRGNHLAEAQRIGTIAISGDAELVKRLLDAVIVPERQPA